MNFTRCVGKSVTNMSQKRTKFKWKQLCLKMIVVWKPKTIKEREHSFRELGIFELEGDP